MDNHKEEWGATEHICLIAGRAKRAYHSFDKRLSHKARRRAVSHKP